MIYGDVALKIPTSIGALSFALVGTACSDAYKVSHAYEKVCKAQCECPPQTDYWNDVKNCKKACEGEADAHKAGLEDHFEDEEPCKGIDDLAKELEDCADRGCSGIDDCVGELYVELAECLGYGDQYYYDYNQQAGEAHLARAIQQELSVRLLYGPTPLQCDAPAEDVSPLCEVLGEIEPD